MSERQVVRLRAHASTLLPPALALLVLAAPLGWALGRLGERPGARTAVVVLAVLAVTWLVVRPFLRWWTTTWTLTDRRLSLRWGVLSRHGRDVPLRRVVDAALRRSLLQRMVGSGTVVLQTAGEGEGRGQDTVELRSVPQARRVYAALCRLTAVGDDDADDTDDVDDWDEEWEEERA